MKTHLLAASFAASIGVAACSANSEATGSGVAGGSGSVTGSGTGGGSVGVTTGSGGSDTVGVGSGGSSGTGGPNNVAEVYGESADTLYRLDPDTKAVTVIGAFQGCSSVLDIALDKDSNMIASTYDGLYRIDRQSAACTLIAYGDYPNSLSFVPEGTVDPNHEVLVGYLGSEYVRIDPQTGDITSIGGLAGGYSSSGDIVSVKGGKTLLTVKGPNCYDCIVEVDPANGNLVKNWGSLNHSDVFGLAFWAGSAYAFSASGQLFEVTFQPALATTPIAIPSVPPDLSFWGAGFDDARAADVHAEVRKPDRQHATAGVRLLLISLSSRWRASA